LVYETKSKSSNLFLGAGGRNDRVKVVDFGIAKLLENQARHTATQIGTPAYAAPEQLGVLGFVFAPEPPAHGRSYGGYQGGGNQ
jgi:serine/threonine protein kinase